METLKGLAFMFRIALIGLDVGKSLYIIFDYLSLSNCVSLRR